MVFSDGDIIVIGGLGENCRMLASCERYSVNDDQWKLLPDLKVPAMNSSVCVFNDRFLYKFGGNKENEELANCIERLDLQAGTEWEIVNLINCSLPGLTSSGCAFQVNRDSILFFGGTYDMYSQKSDKIWLCKVQKHGLEMTEIEETLPIAEGFWMQQSIVFNNSGIRLVGINWKFTVFKM